MGENNQVVVHYVDGKIMKGTTQDFFPNRTSFHLIPLDGGSGLEVRTKQLKAVFFVRDFTGDPHRKDFVGFLAGPGETAQGKKIAVLFRDGELMCGYSLSFSPERQGFFIFPADTSSNNLRVYVLTTAALEVRAGAAADTLVDRVMKKSA
ncbi:MAG: hypothetical protein A2W00_06055 [Candidatus Eisenbacteria bacterium RBG_16_71_46]|nr:MAG: hypothetical protein A2W00_06055 [Candidatus Eisenbacteria bacterium RBG_16_71_46]